MQDNTSPYNILFEEYKKHGDIAITKNMPEAISVPSEIKSASKDHCMVAVMCPLPAFEKNSAAKPAAKPVAGKKATPRECSADEAVVSEPPPQKMALEPQPNKPAHESSAGKPVDTNRPRSADKASTAASSSARTAADVDNDLNAAVNF